MVVGTMGTRIVLAAGCLALVAAPAHAATSARVFNADGQAHADACATPAASPTALRFSDADPTGFELTTDQLAFDEDGRCPAGTARLDLHELIPSAAGPLAFHRGGNGYLDEQNVKYGHLPASAFAQALPPPRPSRGGRGAPCAVATGPAYEVAVESIPAEMHYKRPQDLPSGTNRGSSYEHYGDPGADQGTRTDVHYSYVVWSFLDARGGGMVRALLEPGQVVRPCDVEPIELDSWDRQGIVNGHVTARYVRTLAGSCPIYGWMVWSHTFLGDATGPVAHASALGAAPPADPTPDPACPVAAAATPPVATTGDAAAGADGTWTVDGTVDAQGVPTAHRFEYGTGPEYGQSTSPRTISATAEGAQVTAVLGTLPAGTTFHYRLVAASAHGTSAGTDRTFTTPDPPPPPEPPPPPPPPPVVQIAGLRVAPGALRRARSARGATAAIGFAASGHATVTLRFTRRKAGILRAGRCRSAPPRPPRGARRCVLWAKVRERLTHPAAAGMNSIRFGGWLAARPLPLGAYRVSAAPVDGLGRAGAVRVKTFRIR
jgi:hypothetical protein